MRLNAVKLLFNHKPLIKNDTAERNIQHGNNYCCSISAILKMITCHSTTKISAHFRDELIRIVLWGPSRLIH